MNINDSNLAYGDLPPLDRNGDAGTGPAGDRARPGFGQDDVDDRGWLKRRAALLERLVERGVDVAGELPALAKAQSGLAEAVTECLRKATPEGRAALGELAVTLHRGNVDFALMYERISRSVRRCIAMREQAPPLRASAAAGGRNGAAAPRSSASVKPAAKVERDPEVEAEKDMAAGRSREGDGEDLFSDLYDRPEDPTGMADLGLDRPIKELVAEICRDFGVDGRVWAERLGIGEEMTAASEAATRQKHPSARRSNPQTDKYGREPAADHARPPDYPAADPRGRIDFGLDGRNRRERRAAAKLARKRPPPRAAAPPANDRHPDGGCGPP
jgi:hypothetical protein